MKTIVPCFAVALLLLPVLAAADEPESREFACSIFPGSASLRVDGSLSDWDSRTAAQPLKWSKPTGGELTDDSTATARCLADDSFLYLGIAITADPLRFETMPFDQGWRNDAVEVFISSQATDPSTHIRTGLIRVSSDSSGRTVTEGSASITDGVHTTRKFSYPLLWEAVGVKTGFQTVPSGYSVEVAIPRHSIGWTDAVVSPRVSINVRVRRSCGDKPCQAVIQSSNDPYNSSPGSDELYRPLSFDKHFPATVSAFPSSPKNESLEPLVYGAILRLDALDADGAVALLRESQDQRLLPIIGSALMAAGYYDSAVSVLSGVSTGEFSEAIRLWATEQIARSHLLEGASSVAEGGYATLAASGHPAFRDIGVAGLVDLALDEGEGDAAMAAYQAAFEAAPGARSASRIADWLQKHGRVAEAIDVLTRLSECEWVYDSERAWALLQLQSLYRRNGDIEKAVAAGWRLQSIAPPGDRSSKAGLKMLIATAASGGSTLSTASSFSDSYQRFLEMNPGATDPARQIAFAVELRRERKFDAAAALYEQVSREPGARRTDRTAALLGLQRLLLESGQLERSAQIGRAIHESFPRDLDVRLASLQLIRAAGRASGMPNFFRQAEDLGQTLAADLRSSTARSTGAANQHPRALLLQFDKEFNQQ